MRLGKPTATRATHGIARFGVGGSGSRGESLIEILIAVALLGVTLVALTGGLFVTIGTTSAVRNDIKPDNNIGIIMNEWSDSIALSAYGACDTAAQIAQKAKPPAPLPPATDWQLVGDTWTRQQGQATFEAQVVQVGYWDPAADSGNGAFTLSSVAGGCPSNPSGDAGIVQILLRVTTPTSILAPSSAGWSQAENSVVKRCTASCP